MLFFAPRSGEEMRAEVRDKAQELRDRTAETVKDTVANTVSQVKSKADHLTGGVKGKAQGIKKQRAGSARRTVGACLRSCRSRKESHPGILSLPRSFPNRTLRNRQ